MKAGGANYRLAEKNLTTRLEMESLSATRRRSAGRLPALQPVDVLLPPPPAVLSRLLVADLPPDLLQNSLLGL